MKQTVGGFVCVDGHTRIEKSAFLKDDDGKYYLPEKGSVNTYDDEEFEVRTSNERIQTLDIHLNSAGDHLQNFFIRQLYAIGLTWFNFLFALDAGIIDGSADDDDLLKIRLIYIGASYNFYMGMLEVNNAGIELKKASKSLRK